MEIRCDSRGKGEDEIFQALRSHATDELSVSKRALDVGDFHVVRADTGEVACVVERKTHSDLASSLKVNQHMKEQVIRLRAFKAQHPRCAVFLLYEGGVSAAWFRQSTQGFPNLSGDMYVTVAATREGLCTHSTGSREHTAAWLVRMARKELKGELRPAEGAPADVTEADVLRTLSTSKAGNLVQGNQWARMLMSVNSISADRALAIAAAYPSCAALVKAIDAAPEETQGALANLTVKKRRIGPAAAKLVVSAVSQ